MRIASLGLVALLLLSGCSDGGPEPVEDADFTDLDLVASSSTGVIRGVVVDEAIRPLAGATIALRGDAKPAQTTTDAGTFGFDGLEPGTYFLDVSKPGYLKVQQSVEVVAAVAEPPIAKVLLAVDTSFVAPYFETFVFEGFIECGVTTPVIAGAICGIPNGATCGSPFPPEACLGNVTNDNFSQFIPVTSVPTYIQHELVWDATQSTGNMFNLAARWATDSQFSDWGEIKGAIGVSPVIISLNATEIEGEEIGLNGTGLGPSIFSGGMEGTQVCTEPIGCLFATGATIEQSFTLYTNLFYGYTPPEGWTFVATGSVPPPPA